MKPHKSNRTHMNELLCTDEMQGIELIGHSINGASASSGLGRTTIYKEIGNGNLIARKCGGRTVILHSDLVAFMRNLPRMELKKS